MARRMIKSFKYQSEVASNGRARWFLPGVPKRDLDEKDIARLSDEDYEAVKSAKMPNGDRLYVRSDQSDDEDDEQEVDQAVEELEAEQDAEAQAEIDAENEAADGEAAISVVDE